MVRPKRCRRIASLPGSSLFKPAGIPACSLGEVVLTVDEFEALRLADYEALYQEQAAERMSVSRQTFGRIVESARKKVAQALVEGQVLRIEGGEVKMAEMRVFECDECGHVWEVPFGTGNPSGCPSCNSKGFHRAAEAPVGSSASGRGRCCRRRHGTQGGRGIRRRGQRSSRVENREDKR